MNIRALVGLILVVYAVFVAYVGYKKPGKLWETGKIRLFRKYLGEQGTSIMFYIFGVVALGFGIWALVS